MIFTGTGFMETPTREPVAVIPEVAMTTEEVSTVDEVILSPVSKSAIQPIHTGHPFVIFAPEAIAAKASPSVVNLLRSGSLKVRKKQPPFFNTDVPMIRIGMCYGDVKTATVLYAALHQLMPDYVFKNWQS